MAKRKRPAKSKSKKRTVKFGQGEIEVDDEPEVDEDDVQPALVPMSEQEVKDAGRKLAGLVRELKELTTKHQGVRAEMKAERTALREEMEAVAQCIRQQGR